MEFTSIFLSVIALTISIVTLWLTLLRKGTVRMTQPTQIFFGPDGNNLQSPKVYFRTLLYSTSKKGRVIENLYVRLKRGETQQNFNIWVYGSHEPSSRGSGLYVGEAGIAANHHLLPKDTGKYEFKEGKYVLEIYVRLVGEESDKLLQKIDLSISEIEAQKLKQQDCGVYFDWGPDSKQYHSHINTKPRKTEDDTSAFLQEILKSNTA